MPLATAIPTNIHVLGMTKANNSLAQCIAIEVHQNSTSKRYLIPITALISGERVELISCLLEAGRLDLLERKALSKLGASIVQEAQKRDVQILSTSGLNQVSVNGYQYSAYLWEDITYWLGLPAPANSVFHWHKAQQRRAGSFDDWNTYVGQRLRGNHFLICVVVHSLASALCRFFGMPRLVISLIGPSGVGKTITQRCGQSLIGPCSEVLTMSGTPAGIREYLLTKPDMPVFFQDARQFPATELISLIFDLADGATRLKSGTNNTNESAIASTLILSNERHLVDMKRTGEMLLDEGIFARCLEIDCSAQYGAFHDIHDAESPNEFAKQLEIATSNYYGTLWPRWLRSISKHFEKIVASHQTLFPKIRQKLVESGGNESLQRVNNRIVESLAFSAWVGVIASKCKVLPLTQDEIVTAYSVALDQYITRQKNGVTPLTELIVAKIRGFLDEQSNRFPTLDKFGQHNDGHTPIGYTHKTKAGETVYLWPPHAFQKIVIDQFGQVALQLLRDAGYLVSTKGRGFQYQVRLPKCEERMSFIALRRSIRFD